MEFRPFARFRHGVAGAALLSALTLAIFTGAASSERMVQTGFNSALADREGGASLATQTAVPQAQSEAFWLGHGPHGEATSGIKPVAWSGQLNRGDRLSITVGRDVRDLEVVETRPIAVEATRLDLASAPMLTAVVCRDVREPNAPLVQFMVTDGATLPFNQIRSDKPST